MRVILQRKISNDKATLGEITLPWIKDAPRIYTLELPWLDNQSKKSCIPAGVYWCNPHVTKNKKGVSRDTWQLQNVPGRDGINFDIANYPSDILGCIAVGFGQVASVPMITNSANAMGYLLTTIGKNTRFEIEIKDV